MGNPAGLAFLSSSSEPRRSTCKRQRLPVHVSPLFCNSHDNLSTARVPCLSSRQNGHTNSSPDDASHADADVQTRSSKTVGVSAAKLALAVRRWSSCHHKSYYLASKLWLKEADHFGAQVREPRKPSTVLSTSISEP